MDAATQGTEPPPHTTAAHSAGGWQVLWFLLHLAAVYASAGFLTPWLAGWTRGTLLPLLQQHPASSGRFQFLFSHILAFSFIPAFLSGLINARFRHKTAQFVWLVPAAVLAYKFATFSAPSVLQNQFSAFHQYFGGGFVVPEFRNYHDLFSIAGSNSDMTRGMAQLQFTGPCWCWVWRGRLGWSSHRTGPEGR